MARQHPLIFAPASLSLFHKEHLLIVELLKILLKVPMFCGIKSFVNTTIAAYKPMFIVAWVNPHAAIFHEKFTCKYEQAIYKLLKKYWLYI